MPVGTAKAFLIRDTLPAGLLFNAGSATVTTAGGPVSYTGTPTPPGQAAQTLTFDFGDVATATVAGEIVVRYTATVANALANQNNVTLVNSAAALYQDPNNAAATITAVAPTNPTVRVGEPNLTVVKSITAGATGADAGNNVDWSFTVSNGGTTTAYRADVRDVLPPGLANIANVGLATTGSITFSGTATPLALANIRVKTTVNTNDTIDVADTVQGDASDTIAIPPGASLTITFRATVMNTVTPGQVLTNTVRVPYASRPDCGLPGVVCRDNSSNPGNVDDDDNAQLDNYEESGSASLTIRSNVAIDKQVAPNAAPIGATVLFTTRVDLIEGTTPNVVVTDVLPAGFTYVSHSIAVGHLGMVFGNPGYDNRLGSGQTVAFDLGTIVNPANGECEPTTTSPSQITARVDNVAANQNGVVLKNGEQAAGSLVTVTYGTVPTTLTFDAEPGVAGIQGRPVTLLEPILAATKSAVPLSQALGDLVTYSITVAHTGASTSNAYDVVLADTLPAFIAFVPGSVNPPGAFGGIVGQVLTLDLGTLTLAAGSTTVTYQGRIANAAVVGVPLVNSVAGSYASQPGATGAPSSGRNGSGGVNDYAVVASAAVTPNANAFIDARKTVAIAVDADGSGNLTPGDTLEYTVVLTNTNGAATGVVFTDPIPGRTSYVPGSATTTRGTIAASASLLTVNVGAMGSGDTVTITFRVTVDAGTPTGTVISNQGSVDSDQTVPEPTDVDGIDANGDQPTDIVVGGSPTPASALYAEKYVALADDADASGSVTQGDRMRYTVVLSNVGSAPLADAAFGDTIPVGLAYVPGSAVASAGVVTRRRTGARLDRDRQPRTRGLRATRLRSHDRERHRVGAGLRQPGHGDVDADRPGANRWQRRPGRRQPADALRSRGRRRHGAAGARRAEALVARRRHAAHGPAESGRRNRVHDLRQQHRQRNRDQRPADRPGADLHGRADAVHRVRARIADDEPGRNGLDGADRGQPRQPAAGRQRDGQLPRGRRRGDRRRRGRRQPGDGHRQRARAGAHRRQRRPRRRPQPDADADLAGLRSASGHRRASRATSRSRRRARASPTASVPAIGR